jgi:FkbM family methyltransferase
VKRINYQIYNNISKVFGIWNIYKIIYKHLPNFYRFTLNNRYGKIEKFKVNIFGVSFYLSLNNFYSKTWVFIRCDHGIIHEEKTVELLNEKLREKKCFVDVGAHLGYFSLFASKKFPSCKIYSFEMDKINFNLLKENVEINNSKNVDIFNLGIFDKTGEVKMRRDSDNPLSNLNLLGESDNQYEKKISYIKTVSLDDFFANKNILPDIVKIDVEGAEMKVLEGMKNLLKTKKPLIFLEVHPDTLYNFDSSVKKILSYLVDNKYIIYKIENLRNIWKEKKLIELDINTKINENSMIYAC